MDAVTATLLSTGIQAVGSLFGGWLGDKTEPKYPSIPWETYASQYGSWLRGEIGEEEERGISRARLEAGRVGGALGGTYLEMVSRIQTEADRIYGREFSKFQISQMGLKQQYQMGKAQAGYEAGVRRQQRWGDVAGTITGGLAAIPHAARAQTVYGETKEMFGEQWEEIKGLFGEMKESRDKQMEALQKHIERLEKQLKGLGADQTRTDFKEGFAYLDNLGVSYG